MSVRIYGPQKKIGPVMLKHS